MPPPVKAAILTAHGQPSAPEGQEEALARLATEVAGFLPDWDIRSATLSTPGRLEQMMVEDALIYPFFVASGWFTTQVLPKRLQGCRYNQLPPFGQDPALPQLAADLLHQALPPETSRGKSTILLAAHGSARGPKAAEATERFAVTLRPLLPGQEILTSYIEQPPYIADVARGLPKDSLCLPFFAQSGNHVTSDLPEALQAAAFGGRVLPSLGSSPGVARLISNALTAATQAAKA
jgi:sirohydrochlorin ferrochelatase